MMTSQSWRTAFSSSLLLEDALKMFYWVQVWRHAWPAPQLQRGRREEVVSLLTAASWITASRWELLPPTSRPFPHLTRTSPCIPPPYSAQPQGYGFSQQYVTGIDQQLNQHHIQQPFSIDQQPNQHHIQQPFSTGQQQHPGVESAMRESPINDYFSYSIFTMVCCFFPLGIAALANSIATRNAIARGERRMAELSSRWALMMNHAALGTGIAVFAISTAVIIFLLVE
ncbi:synapse differentiation-inducing gene protein 1-like [Xiphophorus hellerii]|uniref:synapse differentiation-inducing gene protein 1-like n=1 Tax=Xiphophorus hellerii TaxID=8084 RepID=UPI0013B3E3CE|nr:synapse differentiation-inducing gene protein 1-like [Xiphophorus hellerii]